MFIILELIAYMKILNLLKKADFFLEESFEAFSNMSFNGTKEYNLIKEKKIFTGDTLFSLGCGRIFEGTYEQMFNSLNKIKKLKNLLLL